MAELCFDFLSLSILALYSRLFCRSATHKYFHRVLIAVAIFVTTLMILSLTVY